MRSRAGAAIIVTLAAVLASSCTTPTVDGLDALDQEVFVDGTVSMQTPDGLAVVEVQDAAVRRFGGRRFSGNGTTTTTVPSTSAPATTATPTTAAPPTAPPTTAAPTTAAPTTAPPTTAAPAPSPTSPAGFVHPGVFIDRDGLEALRAHVAAGDEPWMKAFTQLTSSGGSIKTAARPKSYRYGALDFPPAPFSVVQAGSSSTTQYMLDHPELGLANVGHIEHLDDATAAYTHALMWALTGKEAHALKAIEIMNAWSYRLTEIKFDQPRRLDNNGPVYSNGKLQAGWAGSLISRAAEIIRYTYGKWPAADVDRYEAMLRNVYLPLTITNWSRGANWQMTLAEATINIGVFLDDRAVFDAGVNAVRRLAPSTIYLRSDGSFPLPPNPNLDTASEIKSYWFSPSGYPEGLQQETLRDVSHMTLGLGAMANAAETAWLQGVDLYAEMRTRFLAGFERSADYVRQYLAEFDRVGGAPSSTWVPAGFPGTTFRTGGFAYRQGWAVAYHHYTSRMGISMPNTAAVIRRVGPGGPALHLAWDTLTHGT